MLVFNHIPRTGGTFLIEKLRQTNLASGPAVEFGIVNRFIPRVLCDAEYRPAVLIYHFSGTRFEREFKSRPGDFIFTFLRNRVDMVYSNFVYMRDRVRRGDKLPGWTEAQRRYFSRTLEEHIDTLLAAREADFEYPSALDRYDFVGITEEMDLSLSILNQVLGTRMVNSKPLNSVAAAKTYRRRELERKFAPQLELFHAARSRLRATAHVSSQAKLRRGNDLV